MGRGGPVAWITLAWTGTLVLFMLAVPIYQAPDEATHVDRILQTSVAGFPEYDELRYSPEVIASTRLVALSARPDPYRAEDAPARPLPTFAALSAGPADPDAVNQLAGHPPAYYALMGGARTLLTALLPRAAWQFDRDVLLLRTLNVLLMMWLPWVLARTAAALGMLPWQTWVAAALPLCIPQLAHIGSAVNNDNLLISASAVATMLAAQVLRVGLRWAPTLGMAVATAVAIQTKIFGWALVPLVAVVCVVALRRHGHGWWRLTAVAALVAAAGWTYLRSLLLYGHPYPTLAPVGQPVAPEGFSLALPAFLAHLAANTTHSFVGRFGALWLALPRPWTLLVSAGLLACLVIAVVRPSRPGVRLLQLPVLTVAVMYVVTALLVHLETGAYAAQQGRYLFPVVASLGVAVASALAGIGPRGAGALVMATTVIGWLLSVWTLTWGFWAGSGIVGRLASIAAWSPIGGVGVLLLLCAAMCFWLGLLGAARAGDRLARA
jgi:hypothetical protein